MTACCSSVSGRGWASAAREVTKVHSDPNTTVHGVSGSVANVYAGDQIVFRFAHLQQERDNVLSYDTSPISKNVGTEISGFIGFDLLGLLMEDRLPRRPDEFRVLGGPGISAHTVR